MKIILVILLFTLTSFQQGESFKPNIREFKGYLHEVYGNGLYFKYFTKEKKVRLDFIYDSSSKSFSWNDSNVIMIFYGSAYPTGLKQLFHNKDLQEWLKSTPDFPSKEYTCVNNGDRKSYFISTVKSKFTAFDYEEYKQVEKEYAELFKWGIYSKHHIYPNMVKSGNKTFIVNYWN